MTPDMKFEGLLLSRDVQVLKAMSGIMDDLSIQVDLCMSPSRALDLLGKRDIDLLVVDWDENNGSPEIIKTITNSVGRRVTVAAILDRKLGVAQAMSAGAHTIIRKPLMEGCTREFRKRVYSRMLAERRQQPRHAVRWLVAAKDVNDVAVPVTLMDISEMGIGIFFTGKLVAGDLLQFKLLLPHANHAIHFEARIVWTLPGNAAGAEFESISIADAGLLHKCLQQEHRVKELPCLRPVVSPQEI